MKITKTTSATRREMKRTRHACSSQGSKRNDTGSFTSHDASNEEHHKARKPCLLKRIFKRIFSSGRKDEKPEVVHSFEPRLEREDRRLIVYTPLQLGSSTPSQPNFDSLAPLSILPGLAELEAPGSQPMPLSLQVPLRPQSEMSDQNQQRFVRRAASFQSYRRHPRSRNRANTQLSIVTEVSEASLAARQKPVPDPSSTTTIRPGRLPLSRSMSLPNFQLPNNGYEARLSPTSSSSKLSLDISAHEPPFRSNVWVEPQPSSPLLQRIADQHAGRFDNTRNSPLAMNPDIWHLPSPATSAGFPRRADGALANGSGDGSECTNQVQNESTESEAVDEVQRAGSWLSNLLEYRFGLTSF